MVHLVTEEPPLKGFNMHHKKKKPKNSRAGCLMCKPNKMNGWNKEKLGHTGFGKLKDVIHSKDDLKNESLY